MTPNELERFWKKVRVTPLGCWAWLGCQTNNGYGRFRIGDKTELSHRAAYEHFVGPIPEDLECDHICRNRACANPSHLELVTGRENTLRGTGITAQNARKTRCNRGHKFSEANTRRIKNTNWRYCRACKRTFGQKRRLAEKVKRETDSAN